MTGINLGSIVSQNGRNTATGLSSGLDATALIDGILAAREGSVENLEDTITLNDTKVTALGELRTLLDRFRTSANFLRNPPGVNNETNDFFKHTSASLTSNTSIAASTYLSVTSEPGATLSSYVISDIVQANEHIIRKGGISSETASVVGNSIVTDDYSANLTYSSGTELNTTTPLRFSNDISGDKATIDVVFGSQNEFDSADSITFGDTTITFGGGGGDDVDISSASTVSAKLQVIADRLNAITSGEEQKYTYTVDSNTLKVTRDVVGTNSEVGTNLSISADFSTGSTTQTIAVGSQAAANKPTGGALNSLGSEGGYAGKQATLYLQFGRENSFDATDSITFGSTTLTFGGNLANANDLDFSGSDADTIEEKISLIATRLNAITSGEDSDVANYTYTASGTTLEIKRDVVGDNTTVGTNLTVSANFSNGVDTTQTIKIGGQNRTNNQTSGTVNVDGTEGTNAARKSSINLLFSADNEFDVSSDSLTFGSTTITFSSSGGDVGDVLDISGDTTLAEKLQHIVAHLNLKSSGDESNYRYSVTGSNTIVVENKNFGTDSTNLSISSNFSGGAGTDQKVTIGSGGASEVGPSNGSISGNVNTNGTTGIDRTTLNDRNTSVTTTLSGNITLGTPLFISGSGTADSFTPNSIEFKATVGGETYTSRPVILEGGSTSGGAGSGGFGNSIASGTVITFVKDVPTDSTDNVKDVTFQLVVGDAITIADQSAATTYSSSIQSFLTTNSVSISQESEADLPFRAGTFELNGIDITLTQGDDLQIIRSKINAVTASTGVSADIIKVSDNNFSLVLKSTQPGVANKIVEFGDGDLFDPANNFIKFGGGNVLFTDSSVSNQTATDASFKLDGQTITRSTNVINDVIDNVTFSLLNDSPSGTNVTTVINSDNDLVQGGIVDFLNSYNDLKFFISAQTERNASNELVEEAVLGDENILNQTLRNINDQLTRTISGVAQTSIDTLFEVGIDFIDFPGDSDVPETKDIFVLDQDKFNAAITANFEAVRNVFSFNLVSSSPELNVFERGNNLTITDFKLVIDTSATDGEEVSVTDASGTHLFYADYDADNNTITGPAGSALDGLVLIYTGSGSETITVNATQGVADSVFNVLDNILRDDVGALDITIEAFQDENTRLQEDIDEEKIRINNERERLIGIFTELEAKISQFNRTLDFFNAERAALFGGN